MSGSETRTPWGPDDAPGDVKIQARIEQAIAEGHSVPRWGFPMLRPFNGYSGPERVRGWQITRVGGTMGLISWPNRCSICDAADRIGLHSELYGRPLLSQPICRSCHFHVHRRFRQPERWQAFLRQHGHLGWARRVGVKELTRREAYELERLRNPLGLADS